MAVISFSWLVTQLVVPAWAELRTLRTALGEEAAARPSDPYHDLPDLPDPPGEEGVEQLERGERVHLLRHGHSDGVASEAAGRGMRATLGRMLPEDFLRKLKESSVDLPGILDIGANEGGFTKGASSVYTKAQFLMVDANEHEGCSRVAAKRHGRCVTALLSDRIKDVVWYSKNVRGIPGSGSSYLKEQTRAFENVTGEKRTTETLDSVVEKYGNGTRFKYIKIDAQGAEIDILKGGSKTVSSAEFIQMEMPFGGVQYNSGVPSYADEIKYMDGIGFTPVAECEQHELKGYQFQIDLIFAKKDSAYIKRAQGSVNGAYAAEKTQRLLVNAVSAMSSS